MLTQSTIGRKMKLGNTNCSMDMEGSDREEKITAIRSKGKKRIGRYSFYPKNQIGSGYSSKVYRGIKDNNKSQLYAIKVIKLKDMNASHLHLLNNQIDIIQRLDHPNIVRFIDVQYTSNHCYLITEHCEGGNLEQYAQENQSVEWGSIIYQISQACQYLTHNHVIHRDLKPANIFLKNGRWKIGDFGFSKRMPNSNTHIMENYKIGSPLFMPLQSLERNMYSMKSDSFALGVIIYFLIFKEFPWIGNNVPQLIKMQKSKVIDWNLFQFLPLEIASIVKGLCNTNVKERLQLSNCNFQIFLAQKSIKEINYSLQSMKPKITQQVILCQFINYLIKNSIHFLQDDHILYSLMSKNLYHLTEIFKWQESKCLKEMKREYILPEGNVKVCEQDYGKILFYLESTINLLKFRKDSQVYQVALSKLLEYYCICKYILEADIENLQIFLKSVTLHKNFKDLLPNHERILYLMSVTLKKQ